LVEFAFQKKELEMRLSDFKYNLPERLIAQEPANPRDSSKMLVVNREDGSFEDKYFHDFPDYVKKGDALVINVTRVFPARLKGYKEKTEADIEVFLLRQLNESLWEVMVKPARKVRTGNTITVADNVSCEVIDNTTSGGRVVRFHYEGDFQEIIEKYGLPPLPPYIKREPTPEDRDRYQTVYATTTGAVAAPTAGLHFTIEMLDAMKKKGVIIVPIVLHVGLGTFRAVSVEDLTRHRMDSEYFEVTEESCQTLNEVIDRGGKIFSVGTTTTRTLETASTFDGGVKPCKGWTDKFIYPPYQFKVVSHLLTNLHLPGSTLLMLVCAFADRDLVFKVYRHAIRDKYRFFTYGDSMLIL
jgi:S-adenosylmethionine:tRNA ribosyltransferase-isomerase